MLGSQPGSLFPRVSDSPPIHQPHHTHYLGSCHSKITCDRPLESFTHSENHSNKTSNAKGLLHSTLPPSGCVVRAALECVELFTPALNGIGLLYIFNSYIWSFFIVLSIVPLLGSYFFLPCLPVSAFLSFSFNLLCIWRPDHKDCYNYICMKSQ